MERKETFQSRDVNAVAAIGRAVAMLQAVEESRVSRVGGKSVKEIPTAKLRALIGVSELAEEESEDAES
jgi:hypothetical protein